MKTRILILFVLVLIPSQLIYAVPELDHEMAYDYSDKVLVGKIISVKILSEPRIQKSEFMYSENHGFAVYEVEVENYLKSIGNENQTVTVPGPFLREEHGMSYETVPYEVGQRVLLYLQKNTIQELKSDLIIRSGDSRVLDGPVCDLGTFYHKGECLEIPDCPPRTKFTDGVCVVIPVERGIFMHGPLGPFLLVVLVGIVLSPIYAILKFKKPTNKILFIVSVSIAAIIFSQVIYGEFLLVGDQGVAPSANESFFFALSILGSFFVTISFTMLGAVYWKKNKNPNKMMILTFFIIAMIPIIALMTGFLPRGAEA